VYVLQCIVVYKVYVLQLIVVYKVYVLQCMYYSVCITVYTGAFTV